MISYPKGNPKKFWKDCVGWLGNKWIPLILAALNWIEVFPCYLVAVSLRLSMETRFMGWVEDVLEGPLNDWKALVKLPGLGGGFKYFLFSALFGEDSHFD